MTRLGPSSVMRGGCVSVTRSVRVQGTRVLLPSYLQPSSGGPLVVVNVMVYSCAEKKVVCRRGK